MKKWICLLLAALFVSGGALAEGGVRLTVSEPTISVGEHALSPDLSLTLAALADGSALYAEGRLDAGGRAVWPMQARMEGDSWLLRIDDSAVYALDGADAPGPAQLLSLALPLTAAAQLDAGALTRQLRAQLERCWPEGNAPVELDAMAAVAFLDNWLAKAGAPVQRAAAQRVSAAVGGPTRAATLAEALIGLEVGAILEPMDESTCTLRITVDGDSLSIAVAAVEDGESSLSLLLSEALCSREPLRNGLLLVMEMSGSEDTIAVLLGEDGAVSAAVMRGFKELAPAAELDFRLDLFHLIPGDAAELRLGTLRLQADASGTVAVPYGCLVELTGTGGAWRGHGIAGIHGGDFRSIEAFAPAQRLEFAVSVAPAALEDSLAGATALSTDDWRNAAGLLLAFTGQAANAELLFSGELFDEISAAGTDLLDALGDAFGELASIL